MANNVVPIGSIGITIDRTKNTAAVSFTSADGTRIGPIGALTLEQATLLASLWQNGWETIFAPDIEPNEITFFKKR